MASPCTGERPALDQVSRTELERRAARLRPHLVTARARLHSACREVTAAERALLARRIEREEAALRVARLADMLETLERVLDAR